MIIHDRLYRQIEMTEAEARLIRTPEFARLRQVSLSAVPVWTLPAGTCASRAEHSIGAAYLAKVLVRHNPHLADYAQDLFCAALVHDIATPPFSHLTERFLIMLLGRTHEEYATEVLNGSRLAREIRHYGASLKKVLAFVRGSLRPAGPLINGDIDLDNLDNTLRYGLSLGILPGGRDHYSPELLAAALTTHKDRTAIRAGALPELTRWAECREATYAFTYSPANLAPCAMIFRALDLAAARGELGRAFFSLRDDEAYAHLEERCNTGTRALAARARRLEHYRLAYSFTTARATPDLSSYLLRPETRITLADEIARLTGNDPEDVAVHAGRNRAHKRLNLTVVDHEGKPARDARLPEMKETWLLHVYLRDPSPSDEHAIRELIPERLPDAAAYAHD